MALLFGAGLGATAWAQGSTRFDGQYVGALTLAGIISGDCTQPPTGARYPLSIAGGEVRFKYVPRFDTTLIGRVDASGALKATARLAHGTATMTGRVEGTDLTAQIVTPSCMYSYSTKN